MKRVESWYSRHTLNLRITLRLSGSLASYKQKLNINYQIPHLTPSLWRLKIAKWAQNVREVSLDGFNWKLVLRGYFGRWIRIRGQNSKWLIQYDKQKCWKIQWVGGFWWKLVPGGYLGRWIRIWGQDLKFRNGLSNMANQNLEKSKELADFRVSTKGFLGLLKTYLMSIFNLKFVFRDSYNPLNTNFHPNPPSHWIFQNLWSPYSISHLEI